MKTEAQIEETEQNKNQIGYDGISYSHHTTSESWVKKRKKQPWTSREYESSKLMPIKKDCESKGNLLEMYG